MHRFFFVVVLSCACVLAAPQQQPDVLRPLDVFDLEYAKDPRVSPDGQWVAYIRSAMDIQTDRSRTSLWLVNADGSWHREIANGPGSVSSPRWSPDGARLVWVRSKEGVHDIRHLWMEDGSESSLATMKKRPSGITWSRDGKHLAFSRFVAVKPAPFVELPTAPAGAEWAPRPKVIDKVLWRDDGKGILENGHHQLFVLTSEGGTPRQLTKDAFDHRGPVSWSDDGKHLIFSADRRENGALEPGDSEVYELDVASGALRPLTDRHGPDNNPVVAPDGKRIAYLGYDNRFHGYEVTKLWLMDRDGGNPRALTAGLDRSVRAPAWGPDGETVWFLYDDEGSTRIGKADLEGNVEALVGDVGGTSLGRPYASGSFTVSTTGAFAYTSTTATRPADVSLGAPGRETRTLTRLNDDVLKHRRLATVEEMWVRPNQKEDVRIQSWIVKPPGFDPKRRYPLILEIHGGPFANYGPRFAAEMQLYAAAGYVVLYVNPRGSTSYGKEFGNLIHHAYPGRDYDDLMASVDGLISRGFIDPKRLFITGGSGGGVLTAWTVGKTDRFRAAVSAKPVINWYSFVLTADRYAFFTRYWFPGPPWEHADHYLKRSPIHFVGNIKTPTMLLTGEEDWRTPISESEQLYQALKLRGVDTMLVRFPKASHSIAARPSHLIAKVAHVLAWFRRYDTAATEKPTATTDR